jgi:hypothetical protein
MNITTPLRSTLTTSITTATATATNSDDMNMSKMFSMIGKFTLKQYQEIVHHQQQLQSLFIHEIIKILQQKKTYLYEQFLHYNKSNNNNNNNSNIKPIPGLLLFVECITHFQTMILESWPQYTIDISAAMARDTWVTTDSTTPNASAVSTSSGILSKQQQQMIQQTMIKQFHQAYANMFYQVRLLEKAIHRLVVSSPLIV